MAACHLHPRAIYTCGLGAREEGVTMTHSRILVLVALAVTSIWPARADPQATEGRYRGMIVCEKMADTPNTDILHVPLDLIVRGGNVQFARPTFNPTVTRVTGSELGIGTIEPDGKLHLTSEWNFRGVGFQGDYSGTLTAAGGTISGTQTWHGPNGIDGSRSCHAALVPAPKVEHASAQ